MNTSEEVQKIGFLQLQKQTRQNIREKIIKACLHPTNFFHIVSINPEIFIEALHTSTFQAVIKEAQIRIIDGVGMQVAARILQLDIGERYAGVDLMQDLCNVADSYSLRVVLLGGTGNLAESIAACQQRNQPHATFIGLEGFKNIKNPTQDETEHVFSIIRDTRPHIIFAAFGSPFQEIWFWENREVLKGIVCMGVGGSFDFMSGRVSRAPLWIRKIGFEWLYRLMKQPWRWKRQLKLIEFMAYILKEKFKGNK